MMRSLRLFPDSGYHSVFFPLWSENRSVREELDCSGEVSTAGLDWLKKHCSEDDWSSPRGKAWLKTRLGRRLFTSKSGERADVLGLWCAVETNIGTMNRGYLYRRATSDHRAENSRRTRARLATGGLPINGPASQGDIPTDPSDGSYVVRTATELPAREVIDLSRTLELPREFQNLQLEVNWLSEGGDPIDVDLIVDFGNSRTVVLALERAPLAQGFSTTCRPILFPEPGWGVDQVEFDEIEPDQAIPDSWLMLMEPVFRPQAMRRTTWQPPAGPTSIVDQLKKLVGLNPGIGEEAIDLAPHMFRDLSPALIGRSATRALSKYKPGAGGISFLSSPKRYVWDDDPMGVGGKVNWTMKRQSWRETGDAVHQFVALDGEIMRFMPNATSGRDFSNWPIMPDVDRSWRPNHPRSDALVWAALTILEQASRQIQTESWRRNSHPQLKRRLNRILLTYPPGWTEEEAAAYHSKWEVARDIYLLSREASTAAQNAEEGRLKVTLELDEAVAPQLAIVYSEMRHLSEVGENWIELFGRGRGAQATVRVMAIDIGGGTTDTSIAEYKDQQAGAGISLLVKLLFKDSTNVAGDQLVKDIIESVLLPQLGCRFAADSRHKSIFEKLFYTQAKRDGELAEWSVIARTVLIPIVHGWLRELSNATAGEAPEKASVTPSDVGASREQMARLNSIGRGLGLPEDILFPDEPLVLDVAAIEKVIHDWFLETVDRHARYLQLFDCDLVILTGKPSELPAIRKLLERRLPVASHRIIAAKGYFAGDWMPLAPEGEIADAKLVTALGGAVARGIETGLLPGWRIDAKRDETARYQNYWGRIGATRRAFEPEDVVLDPSETSGFAMLLTNTYIGRARFLRHVLPEQVYQLVLASGEQKLVEVEFARSLGESISRRYLMSAESLKIVRATDLETGKSIPLDEIRLRLCTLSEREAHWQDTGRFEIRWPTRPAPQRSRSLTREVSASLPAPEPADV